MRKASGQGGQDGHGLRAAPFDGPQSAIPPRARAATNRRTRARGARARRRRHSATFHQGCQPCAPIRRAPRGAARPRERVTVHAAPLQRDGRSLSLSLSPLARARAQRSAAQRAQRSWRAEDLVSPGRRGLPSSSSSSSQPPPPPQPPQPSPPPPQQQQEQRQAEQAQAEKEGLCASALGGRPIRPIADASAQQASTPRPLAATNAAARAPAAARRAGRRCWWLLAERGAAKAADLGGGLAGGAELGRRAAQRARRERGGLRGRAGSAEREREAEGARDGCVVGVRVGGV